MAVDCSVAIIFKNDVRCIERCLKSLQPLREQVSCEVVMADTGSTDGSREIAERYADVVFDFAWIDDFSAARNAVFDRCSGRWAFVIDCDEWLDDDVGQLADFLREQRSERYTEGVVLRRDYYSEELDQHSQIRISRVFRMSVKPRYEGAIHEAVTFDRDRNLMQLERTVLHHDGYIMLNDGSDAGKKKRERNLTLLRAQLEKTPEDLRTLMQWLEIGKQEPDFLETARRAVRLVEEKGPYYEAYGPGILRAAVNGALYRKAPETEQWIGTAERLFPDSPVTSVDIALQKVRYAEEQEDWDACVRWGEAYLRAYRKFQRGKRNATDILYISLNWADEATARDACLLLAKAYHKTGDGARAYGKLRELSADMLSAGRMVIALMIAAALHVEQGIETELLLRGFWDACADEADKKAQARRRAFLDTGRAMFAARQTGERAGWEIFLPLAGRCPLGDVAALLRCETAEEADAILSRLEDVSELAGTALVHALKLGAAFPVPGRPLTLEETDALAVKLAVDRPFLREAAMFAAFAAEDDADVIWARALILAAIRDVDWGTDKEAGPLLRSFVRVTSAFLARCYSERALRTPEYLPPLYRFALHFANAFSILDAAAVSAEFMPTVSGGVRDALAELKAAALAAPDYKTAVDRVLDDILRTAP